MWIYEKKLQYPVNICTPDIRMAKFLMAQYGGPDSDEYGHKQHRIRPEKQKRIELPRIDVLSWGKSVG